MHQNPFGIPQEQLQPQHDFSEVRNIVTNPNPNLNLGLGAPVVGSEAPLNLDLGNVQERLDESVKNSYKAAASQAVMDYSAKQFFADEQQVRDTRTIDELNKEKVDA